MLYSGVSSLLILLRQQNGIVITFYVVFSYMSMEHIHNGLVTVLSAFGNPVTPSDDVFSSILMETVLSICLFPTLSLQPLPKMMSIYTYEDSGR